MKEHFFAASLKFGILSILSSFSSISYGENMGADRPVPIPSTLGIATAYARSDKNTWLF